MASRAVLAGRRTTGSFPRSGESSHGVHSPTFPAQSSDDVLRRSPLSVWTRRDSRTLYVSTVCCQSCRGDGASRDSASWLFVHATLPWCERDENQDATLFRSEGLLV